MHKCICAYVCVHMCTYVRMYMCTDVNMCMHMCICAHMCIHMCVCICAHIKTSRSGRKTPSRLIKKPGDNIYSTPEPKPHFSDRTTTEICKTTLLLSNHHRTCGLSCALCVRVVQIGTGKMNTWRWRDLPFIGEKREEIRTI